MAWLVLTTWACLLALAGAFPPEPAPGPSPQPLTALKLGTVSSEFLSKGVKPAVNWPEVDLDWGSHQPPIAGAVEGFLGFSLTRGQGILKYPIYYYNPPPPGTDILLNLDPGAYFNLSQLDRHGGHQRFSTALSSTHPGAFVLTFGLVGTTAMDPSLFIDLTGTPHQSILVAAAHATQASDPVCRLKIETQQFGYVELQIVAQDGSRRDIDIFVSKDPTVGIGHSTWQRRAFEEDESPLVFGPGPGTYYATISTPNKKTFVLVSWSYQANFLGRHKVPGLFLPATGSTVMAHDTISPVRPQFGWFIPPNFKDAIELSFALLECPAGTACEGTATIYLATESFCGLTFGTRNCPGKQPHAHEHQIVVNQSSTKVNLMANNNLAEWDQLRAVVYLTGRAKVSLRAGVRTAADFIGLADGETTSITTRSTYRRKPRVGPTPTVFKLFTSRKDANITITAMCDQPMTNVTIYYQDIEEAAPNLWPVVATGNQRARAIIPPFFSADNEFFVGVHPEAKGAWEMMGNVTYNITVTATTHAL